MRGFTLIELLGVLALLAIILLISVPLYSQTMKNIKQKAYELEITKIEAATKNFISDNIKKMPIENGTIHTILLEQLKLGGYISIDLTNPITNKKFPNDMQIEIKRELNEYNISILEETGVDPLEFNDNIPFIFTIDKMTVDVYFGNEYNDPGIIVIDQNNNKLTYTTVVKKDDEIVPFVDTNVIGTYKIYYKISYGSVNKEIIRTINVKN